MIGPVTWLRNRRAVKRYVAELEADDDFQADLLRAQGELEGDLIELALAGLDEEWVQARAEHPEPDPATDGIEHE